MLRWLEGFEVRGSGQLARLYTFAGSFGTTTGRKHGTAVRAVSTQLTTPALVAMVEDVWIVHFAIRKSTSTALSASVPGILISDGVGSQLELRMIDAVSPDAGNFQMQLLRGATVLATSPIYHFGNGADAWHVFQLKATIDPAAGTYELLHYDYAGTETTAIAAAVAQNTANQGTAGADRMTFRTGTSGAVQIDMDDIVVMDDTGAVNNDFFAAPVVVLGELPNANGDTNDFQPSTGQNFECVNDASTLPDLTDEVTSSNVGDVDLYAWTNAQLDLLPTGTPPTVHGIMVDVEAEMKNSGTANLRVEVRDGMDQATDTKDLDFEGALKTSRFAVLEENPTGTPAPWTPADLISIQLGINYDS